MSGKKLKKNARKRLWREVKRYLEFKEMIAKS